jgi:hypothetical protein
LDEAPILLIGTLERFRRMEAEDRERADVDEGTKTERLHVDHAVWSAGDEPAFVRSLIRLGPGAQNMTFDNVLFDQRMSYPDVYVYCTTEQFDADVMNKLGGSCVMIGQVQKFFNAVDAALLRLARDGVLARCTYEARVTAPGGATPTHPCFVKEPVYAHQREVRAMWAPIAKGPIQPVILACPELVGSCRLYPP